MSENILTGTFPENDYRYYLEHHGILGMKWGVRRFQNKDGSLTKKGKARYGSNPIELTDDEYDKFTESKHYKKARDDAYKDTLKWFEENDPEYLNGIIKENGGSKKGLDDFHDFRKTFEGYHDEHIQKQKSIWKDQNDKSSLPKDVAKGALDGAVDKALGSAAKAVLGKPVGSSTDVFEGALVGAVKGGAKSINKKKGR